MREAAGAARDPWWIIGSAAMALHGVEGLQVGDIDLLTSRRDAAALLGAKGGEPGEPGGRFRSDIFGRWRAGAYGVDVMGGFRFDGRELVPRTRVARGGLFVPAVEELIAMCETFERPKDAERATRLRDFLARRGPKNI
ncbi:MAG: hypothetical protein ACJ8EB_08765 [Allosphingosinicella sp.]